MADFTALKEAIQNAIKQNGQKEITGEVLQTILLSMVSTLGDSAINNLIDALETAVTTLQNSIGDEATARQSAVSTLTQNLNTEAQTRSYQDSQLANAIQGEASLRGQADSEIIHNLNVEAQTRANAILNEATLRQGEDYQLRLQINGLSMDFDQLLEDVRQVMQNYRPIVINGNVTNAPDENDLTTTPDNLLKFKDNVYAPLIFSGMGKKFLRKNIRTLSDSYPFDGFVEDINPQEELSGTPAKIFWDREGERFVGWVDGVYYLAWTDDDAYVPVSTENIYMYDGNPYKWNGEDFYVDDEELPNVRNVLTQDMIAEANTIYVIRYDYTLAEDITIPTNCVLQFDGGSINGGYTLTLGSTKCFGVNGIKCKITSDYPIRTSLCGIGTEYEEDSAQRLSDLVNNSIKIIVDTNITCLSPVISDKKSFYFVGDYSNGYRRPAYTIRFPNSEGFVLTSGTEEATTNITWGHTFRNLNIISDGTCINFWPENHIGVFAENTFENLYLQSNNGDCINYGENYTSLYQTAGFNQYFRQIEARAYNGACFRNIRANILVWEHITIYGSKDGGFYNCTGKYHNVIFDQADNEHIIYGWRWVSLNESGSVVSFIDCHFENLKHPIYADISFNGIYEIRNFYTTLPSTWDEDGKKKFNFVHFGNPQKIIVENISYASYGGGFDTGYYMFNMLNVNINYEGQRLSIHIDGGSTVAFGSYSQPYEALYFNRNEFNKEFARNYPYNAIYRKLGCTYFFKESLNYDELTFGDYNQIINSGALGRTLRISTSRTISGYGGEQMPYNMSLQKIFEFDIINTSSGNVTLTHRSTPAYTCSHCFNSFTGKSLVLRPKEIAHCVFNGAQTQGAVVTGKYIVNIVSVTSCDAVAAGDTRPSTPYIGQQFFDTTSGIEKPIWYKGKDASDNPIWVDATGATV